MRTHREHSSSRIIVVLLALSVLPATARAQILPGRPSDFNGDVKTDLLWYNASTGQTSVLLMDRLNILSGVVIRTDPNWQVIGTGDLNGDGEADLLWYNQPLGQTEAWLMSGTNVLASATLSSDPNQLLIAAADLNGDHKTDLIWKQLLGLGPTSA